MSETGAEAGAARVALVTGASRGIGRATAARLAPQQPEAARDICSAIIKLYQGDAWAADVVAEARTQLDTLNAADD